MKTLNKPLIYLQWQKLQPAAYHIQSPHKLLLTFRPLIPSIRQHFGVFFSICHKKFDLFYAQPKLKFSILHRQISKKFIILKPSGLLKTCISLHLNAPAFAFSDHVDYCLDDHKLRCQLLYNKVLFGYRA